MLIHVNDAVTLQGARALRQPLIIPYGIHQEYELRIVTGHDNRPVDIESRGCVKWTLTVTPSPENPTKVLAYAVFPENIATGNSVRFDLAATSVEMYKHVAGNPATPAVMQLQGFTEEDAPATLVITLPVALVTTAQQRMPVDLSTALMQEIQLATSIVGAAQREISKYAGDSTDAAERAEQAAMNAHASEVNAGHSATAAGVSAGNARESELAAEGSAIAAAGSASDALVSAEAAHESELAAKSSEDAAALSESNAHDSEVAAKASEDAALASQNAAHDSEVAAKASEDAALASQNAAHASEHAAAQSASTAATHEGNAEASATAAAASAQAAATSETNADASDTSAQLAAQAAEYARNGAVDAKVLAETAQSAAESAATEAADDTADAIEGQFRDDLSALSAAVNSAQSAATVATTSQQSASASATSAQQSAAEAYEYAQQAGLNTVLILDAPPTVNTAAAVGKLAIWHDTESDKNRIYHLGFISIADSSTFYHWEECVLVSQGNVAGGYPVLDANGKIASAQLPIAGNATLGLAGINGWYDRSGLIISNGLIQIFTQFTQSTKNIINTKTSNSLAITPSVLDYAVRSVLPNVTEIPAATSDYSLVDSSATTNNHSHVYSHAPTTAPTYRLPQVTNTTIAHYIELTVDFTNVQTYSFLDNAGEPIVPLFTPSIAAGDVYTFKCEYSAVKTAWLIYPQKQGAVADDFVTRGEVGAANGVAPLDSEALIPADKLPEPNIYTRTLGGVRFTINYGIQFYSGSPYVVASTQANIDVRGARNSSGYGVIDPSNLNYAAIAALTDSNHITLTDAQKATAQSVFGVGGPITAIPAATSAYTLVEGIFTHAPTSAPTYTLPNITDDIRTHEVVLIIDFSSVQTFSFLVDGGGEVTFQSYANPTTGDVWAFRCWWYGGKWRICPMKIKNCVTRQLTNGSLAITDAVAGDALALKMVAPRSVVVNQLVQNGDFSDGTTRWNSSQQDVTVADGVCSITFEAGGDSSSRRNIRQAINILSGRTYLITCEMRNTVYASGAFAIGVAGVQVHTQDSTNWVRYEVKATAPQNVNTAYFCIYNYAVENTVTFQIRNIQIVDLTQYFNGDTTLIDSITSWDDLVAYDPRFAQYVEHNTGEVSGVTPTVKVTGKNLFNKNGTYEQGYYGFNNGQFYPSQTVKCFSISVKGGKTYTRSTTTAWGNSITYWKDGVFISGEVLVTGNMSRPTFVVPSNANICKIAIADENFSGNFQLELGSTATSYEPYHDGGTTQAPAPLFAVGNAADEYEAVAGVTTHMVASVAVGTITNTWYKGKRNNDDTGYIYRVIIPNIVSDSRGIMANYTYRSSFGLWESLAVNQYGIISNQIIICLNCDTIQEAKNILSTAILYYELATPTTSASTPAQIALQAGNNTAMQTDGGRLASIDITYESDEL